MGLNNIETEFKVLWIGHKDIEQSLFDLGAKKIFEGVLTAIFYWSTIDGNYKEIRVRWNWEIIDVEYKEPILWQWNWKVMKEIWFKANSIDEVSAFFESIWFKKIRKSIKQRVSYIIYNDDKTIQFDFDKYSDLDWMEIEEFLEIEWDENLIYEYAWKLWISDDRLLNWSAKELSAYYKQKVWKN